MSGGDIFELADDIGASMTPLSSFQTYADYIAKLKTRELQYDWLHDFFKGPGPTPSLTTVYVVDRLAHGMRVFGTRDATGLATLLNPRPDVSDVRARVIIMSYESTWTIDRPMLDFIAMKYQLSALHLFQHLYHEGSCAEADLPTPFDLPREMATSVMFPSEGFVEFQAPGRNAALAAIKATASEDDHRRPSGLPQPIESKPLRPKTATRSQGFAQDVSSLRLCR